MLQLRLPDAPGGFFRNPDSINRGNEDQLRGFPLFALASARAKIFYLSQKAVDSIPKRVRNAFDLLSRYGAALAVRFAFCKVPEPFIREGLQTFHVTLDAALQVLRVSFVEVAVVFGVGCHLLLFTRGVKFT